MSEPIGEPHYKVGDDVIIDEEFYQPSGEIIDASWDDTFKQWRYTVRVHLSAREDSILASWYEAIERQAKREAGGDE